ncbi:MAG: hypothetical protein QOH63_91 [Acidobacteriota bacterium]|nr:hypothetical protein [Acidobacteriota bacterium]
MISRVKEAILKGGGFILDFHMFSNLSICLNFELTVGKINQLYDALKATGLQLSEESARLLENCCRGLEQLEEKARASEVTGTLAITFIHSEPDLRIEVAAHSG